MAGEFQGADLEQVRGYFFKADERQEKLRFALALKEQKAKRSSVSTQKKRPVTHYLAIAASLVAVIGIGFFAWRALQPKKDLQDGLIALQAAFREERPIEGRLSDFNYVPLANQRGESAKVDYVQRDLAAALLLTSVRDNPTASSHHAAAKYYLMLRQFDEANKEFTAALALEPQNAKIHSDYGAALLEEGRAETSSSDNNRQLELYGRSLEHVEKALALDPSLLEALFNRALIFQSMRPSEQAKNAWNAYLQKDSTSPWAEEARRNLKIVEREQRKSSAGPNDNAKLFIAALRNSDEDAAWNVISTNYTSAGNEIVNRLFDSLLGVAPLGGEINAHGTLAALEYVAKLEHHRTGDRFTSDLLTNYSRAGPRSRTLLAAARLHMRTAYSSFLKSQFQEAIIEYDKAKSIYEKAEDSTGTIFVEYRLAHCYVLRPYTQRARAAFSRLLTIAETNQYRWLSAQCLFGLAHASVDEDEYSRALEYGERALAAFEQIGDTNGVLKCLVQLADFNQAMTLIGKSLYYLGRASRLADTQSQLTQRWGILNQIGFSMSSLQLHAAALFYQKEALELGVEFGNRFLASRSHGYVGSAYATMKMYREALNEATQAFEIGEAIDAPEGIEIKANASLRLGDIYREAGSCDQAIPHYDRSLTLYRKLKSENYNYEAHKGKLQCFISTVNKKAVRRELRSVLRLSELYRSRITTQNQRNSFFDAEQTVYDLAILYESGIERNHVNAFEYSEKSRARSLLDAVIRGAKLRKTQSEVDVSLPVVTHSFSLRQIQNRMPARAQLVQYAVLDDRIIIWVITKTDVKYKDVPIGARKLTEKVGAFLETIRQPATKAEHYRKSSAELYSLLIAPIEASLDTSKTLCVIPDKILNYLPFAALLSPAGNYLIQDYHLGWAPSGTLFVTQSAAAERLFHHSDEKLLLVGDPKFNRKLFASLRELPASAVECKEVSGLYPNHQLLLRDDATEKKIRNEIETVDVGHFAMHFVVNDRSEMLSGFPLTPEPSLANTSEDSNGFLQSYEIYSLKLRRMRLAILSACQTGIERQYHGEGAVGAARPFFVAGVPTVVASLWTVDSDATANLMVNFHKHLRQSRSVTQALKRAQLDMIQGDKVELRHPYYWAPFMAIGGISQ